MRWLILSYTLPAKKGGSARVNVWRRLRRMGAISLSGVSVLPERESCVEAMNWLAHEIQQAGGDAIVMVVTELNNLSSAQLAEQFNAARSKDYAELTARLDVIAKRVNSKSVKLTNIERRKLLDSLHKLERLQAELTYIDYFNCPSGRSVEAQIQTLTQQISTVSKPASPLPFNINDYKLVHWVTRPNIHIDRIACVWFIRRFINPNAIIRYDGKPQTNEAAFDMPNALFGHSDNQCSFEMLVAAFMPNKNPAMITLAEMVHQADLHEGRRNIAEAAGVLAILRGWQLMLMNDPDREKFGAAMLDGLYAALQA